jgi:hypothetical protein
MAMVRWTVAAAVLAASWTGARADADALADARKGVQAVYDSRNAAAAKKDPKGILAGCTPDFVYVTNEGQKGDLTLLTKKLVPLLAMAKTLKATTTRQKFILRGNEAVSTVKTHIECMFIAFDVNQPSRLVLDDTSEDTWVNGSKGWLQKKKRSIADVSTLDGKPTNAKIDLHAEPVKKNTRNKGH